MQSKTAEKSGVFQTKSRGAALLAVVREGFWTSAKSGLWDIITKFRGESRRNARSKMLSFGLTKNPRFCGTRSPYQTPPLEFVALSIWSRDVIDRLINSRGGVAITKNYLVN